MPEYDLHNEKELLTRFGQGDELAFRALYVHFQGKIFAFALKHTKSEQIAREVLQSVFIKLWEKRAQVRPDDNFEGYLVRITHNHILNMMRDAGRDRAKIKRAWTLMQEMHDNPETDLIAKELSAVYQRAIEALPPQKKIIYRLRHQEGLSHAAIAEQLNISPLTVKKHMVEASRMIRAFITKYGELGILLFALVRSYQFS